VIYFEALSGLLNRGWAPLRGIVARGFKFINLPVPELYDLARDPSESQNLAASRPKEVAEFTRMLAGMKDEGATQRIEEPADVRERLRSLGYLASNAPELPASFTEQDDPKRLIRFEAALQRANELYLSGKIDEALAGSRALVREQPRMRVALIQLGLLERESGDTGAALAALRRAVALNPRDTQAIALLAGTLTEANRPADAIAILQPYASRNDADTQVLLALALAQARGARLDDALATLERARAADATDANIFLHAGTVRLMAGQRSEARSAFQRALDLDPNLARAHSSLAAIDAEDGRTEQALSHWRTAVALDSGEYARLLAVAITLAQAGRPQQARPYMQFFADSAPADRFAGDIARARQWLASSRTAPAPQQRR
jgi:Flp pilus assembly protein TadD